MSYMHPLHDTDAALKLIDRATDLRVAAQVGAARDGRITLASDLRVLADALTCEADALFEVWVREVARP
jgi:hypothetical protein